jgi:hypothetical protein
MVTFLTFSLVLGILGAFLVYFLDFCFNEGNIFDWYYLWVLRKVEPAHPRVAKVLGLCPICFGFWVGLGYYLICCSILNMPYEFYFIFMPVNSFTVMKLFKN